jgi:hypothetical protein
MIDKKCCVKLYGKVYTAQLPDVCPVPLNLSQYGLIEVGNVSEITLNRTFTDISVPNLQTAVFGDACSAKILDEETIDFTMTCVKTDNLRVALGGSVQNIATATITGEEHTVPANAGCFFVPTVNLIDTTAAVTVTDAGAATTFVAGVDYFVRSSGIELTENTTISDEIIEITYTSLDQSRINPSSFGESNYIMHFDGNNSQNGDPLAYTFYNVRFDPAEALTLLGEDFLTIPVSGRVLPSPCHFDLAGNPLRSTFDLNQ